MPLYQTCPPLTSTTYAGSPKSNLVISASSNSMEPISSTRSTLTSPPTTLEPSLHLQALCYALFLLHILPFTGLLNTWLTTGRLLYSYSSKYGIWKPPNFLGLCLSYLRIFTAARDNSVRTRRNSACSTRRNSVCSVYGRQTSLAPPSTIPMMNSTRLARSASVKATANQLVSRLSSLRASTKSRLSHASALLLYRWWSGVKALILYFCSILSLLIDLQC